MQAVQSIEPESFLSNKNKFCLNNKASNHQHISARLPSPVSNPANDHVKKTQSQSAIKANFFSDNSNNFSYSSSPVNTPQPQSSTSSQFQFQQPKRTEYKPQYSAPQPSMAYNNINCNIFIYIFLIFIYFILKL